MPYNVSHTYALFASILCWTLQRIRPPRTRPPSPSQLQKRAWKLWESLDSSIEIELCPWFIATTDTDLVRGLAIQYPQGYRPTIGKTLVALRNAVAHGDGRIVKPYNQLSEDGRRKELLGFIFKCDERNDSRQVVWKEHVTLLERDMRRVAEGIADRFLRDIMEIDPADEYRRRELLQFIPDGRRAA